jgi:hypothetical protein
MMADFMAAREMRIQVTEILDAMNKHITDLRTIPDYAVNGRPTICWAHILGCCTFCNSAFKRGHIPWDKIPDKFVNEIVSMLVLGVPQVIQREEGSTVKCPKIEPQPAS